MKIFRNVCPRDCFGGCSMLSYIENGKLFKVGGDSSHGFTQGHLCAKGYSYSQYVDNSLRLKYPMKQSKRGSGDWERISWDQAFEIIANKILELNHRYQSNLAIGYNKFFGNTGVLHFAVEGMFRSFGPHTKVIGDLCAGSGFQAIDDAMGAFIRQNPEEMVHSKVIIVWGANPAVTNIHQMKYVFKAIKKGKLIVIDPIFTETAAKADTYIQIKPGTDALLALGLGKIIAARGFKPDHQQLKLQDWEEFRDFLEHQVDLQFVSKMTGVAVEVMYLLADLCSEKPIAFWLGIGLQKNRQGYDSVRSILSLLAIINGLTTTTIGTGLFFANIIQDVPNQLENLNVQKHPHIPHSRAVSSANFVHDALALKDPPLKMLWVASRNPIYTDHHLSEWKQLIDQLELIVTVDLFLTETAQISDIVLPAASHFEEEDLHTSFWHSWLMLNQKALPQFFESKSDLQITRELTKKLNDLSPGFSEFPYERDALDWIENEMTDSVKATYQIEGYQDLFDGPRLRKKTDKNYQFFNFMKVEELSRIFSGVAIREAVDAKRYPFQLLTPAVLMNIHSQFRDISWLNREEKTPIIEMNESDAKQLQLVSGSQVEIYNSNGAEVVTIESNPQVQRNTIILIHASDQKLNNLIGEYPPRENDETSSFVNDCFVDIRRVGRWDHS